MSTLVSQPSLPGTENFWSSAFVAELTDAMPMMVRATQKSVTIRLCARTQRVSADIATDHYLFGQEIIDYGMADEYFDPGRLPALRRRRRGPRPVPDEVERRHRERG